MIVDSHVHIWTAVPGHPRPDMTIVSPINDIPLELLKRHMEDHGVDRAVLVQPVYPGEDNALVADAAVAEPDRFAAVAVVDPRNPDAADRLEHWVGARGCRGLRLRPRIPEEDACFCASSTTALWERCRDSNVVVSVLAGPEHLGRLASWLEGFPEVDVVIDHFAHPLVAGGAASLQPLLALARFPRVFVKVSGYCHFSNAPWPYEECGALNRAVYDHFGLGRLIWGSDFPHSLLKCGYAGTLKVLDRSWDWLTPDERARMLGGTATGLYWPSA